MRQIKGMMGGFYNAADADMALAAFGLAMPFRLECREGMRAERGK